MKTKKSMWIDKKFIDPYALSFLTRLLKVQVKLLFRLDDLMLRFVKVD